MQYKALALTIEIYEMKIKDCFKVVVVVKRATLKMDYRQRGGNLRRSLLSLLLRMCR